MAPLSLLCRLAASALASASPWRPRLAPQPAAAEAVPSSRLVDHAGGGMQVHSGRLSVLLRD